VIFHRCHFYFSIDIVSLWLIHIFFHDFLVRFEVYTAVTIQVETFWFVTPCSVVVGHQRFKRTMRPPSSGWSAWSSLSKPRRPGLKMPCT